MLFLDENPVICVNNTPFSLFPHILQSIKSGYSSLCANPSAFKRYAITEVEPLEDLIIKDFVFSKKNRDWLVQYYNTMSSIYQKKTGNNMGSLIANFYPKINLDKYFTRNLKIHPPVFDEFYTELIEENEELYRDIDDPVLLSRTILLKLEPTGDEFVLGIPDWFSDIQDVEFKAFDPVTKKHIKILKAKDGYKYFVSKISDNWHEIENVPPDMQYIIDYLISSRNINSC